MFAFLPSPAKDDEIIPRLRLYLGPRSPSPSHSAISSEEAFQTSSTVDDRVSAASEADTQVDEADISSAHAYEFHDNEHDDDEITMPPVIMSSTTKYSSKPSALFALQQEHISGVLRRTTSQATLKPGSPVPSSSSSGSEDEHNYRVLPSDGVDNSSQFLDTVSIEEPIEAISSQCAILSF